jgi:hypothetical protein
MSDGKAMRLEVTAGLYSRDGGDRITINESVDIENMTYAQISRLLEAFHIIAESVKEGRHITLNGQEMRYFS